MSQIPPANPFAQKQPASTPPPDHETFSSPSQGIADSGMLNIAVACILFAFVPCGFVAVLLIPGDHAILVQLTTTMPILIGIGLLYSGLAQRKSPKSITLDENGITVVSKSNQSTTYPWSQVALLKREHQLMSAGAVVNIFDTTGKTIIVLPGNFPSLDTIVFKIEAFLALKTDVTATQTVALQKSRKNAIWLTLSAAFFLLLCVGGALLAYNLHTTQKEFSAFAVTGTAHISEIFTAPDGRTRRIKYKIQGLDSKVGENNVEIEPMQWSLMSVGDPFLVKYVPQNPDNNQPVLTGLPDKAPENPLTMVAASIIGLLGFITCTICAVFAFKGYDVDFDSKSLFKLKKVGSPTSTGPA
jgi:hypothetical protein